MSTMCGTLYIHQKPKESLQEKECVEIIKCCEEAKEHEIRQRASKYNEGRESFITLESAILVESWRRMQIVKAVNGVIGRK